MARVAFIMPRLAHDNVRVSHKEAWSLRQQGCQVVLLCKRAPVDRYLGMRVVAAQVRAEGLLRPILNAPFLLRQALSLDADLYVLENPDTLILGFLLFLMRKRVVYSTHEDFQQKAKIYPRVPAILAGLIGATVVACEYALTRIISATVVTQPSVCRRYRPRAILVENAPLTDGPIMHRAERIYSELPKPGLPTLVYAGGITRNRGLYRMLELTVRLNEIRPWKLTMLGHFTHSADFSRASAHEGWRHVEYLGYVPHSLALAHIRSAVIGLALLDDVGGYAEASITKLYEYMLMGTPFVASDFAMWRDSIDDTPAGLFVDFGDMAALTLKINDLIADRERYEQMRTIGRQFIEQRFNWALVSTPLRRVVQDLHRESHHVLVNDDCEQRQSAS